MKLPLQEESHEYQNKVISDGLGIKVVDSHELRKKQRSSKPLSGLPSVQNPKPEVSKATIATPVQTPKLGVSRSTHSDLCPDVRDTPLEDTVQISNFGVDGIHMAYGSISIADGLGAKTIVSPQQTNARVLQPTTNFIPSNPPDLQNPDVFPNLSQSVNPNSSMAVSSSNALDSYVVRRKQASLNQSVGLELEKEHLNLLAGTESRYNSSPNRPLEVSTISTEKISSQNLTPTATEITHQEVHTHPIPYTNPNTQPHFVQNQGKPNKWASLFTAQAPSNSLKLHHFPEL